MRKFRKVYYAQTDRHNTASASVPLIQNMKQYIKAPQLQRTLCVNALTFLFGRHVPHPDVSCLHIRLTPGQRFWYLFHNITVIHPAPADIAHSYVFHLPLQELTIRYAPVFWMCVCITASSARKGAATSDRIAIRLLLPTNV